MDRQKDYFFDDFLKITESSLAGLENINDIIENPADDISDIFSKNTRKEFSEDNSEGINFQLDGYAEINISEDNMIVTADFYPASPGKNLISLDKIKSILFEKKIIYGIDGDLLSESIYRCNTENCIVKDIVIAKGIPSKDEILKHIVIVPDLFEPDKINTEIEEPVDFKDYTTYKIVNKDQLLAEMMPLKPGFTGINVFGEEVKYRKIFLKYLKPGKNTKFSDNEILSACDGVFKYDNNNFWVDEVLHVNGNVDYHTGNINFTGDVIIDGDISDSFKINSKGNIFCNQTMDATEVYCGNDLQVKNGIIGRKDSIVKVKGSIKAKFIEHCYVEAYNSIYLEIGALNSYLYTTDKLIMSHKGLIVGGTIYASNGIVTTQIGTAMGPKTELYCGTDFNIVNRMNWIREKTIELATALKKVRDRLLKSSIDLQQKMELEKYREQLQGGIHKLNEASCNLLSKLDKNTEADIVVRGSIYPGVYIEICHVSHIVSRKMNKVRFRLDKKKGRVVCDNIGIDDIRQAESEYITENRGKR